MVFKIIALALMASFYICYFAKMISQKKQGIDTDQLGKGKVGFVKFIEVTLKTSTYLLPAIEVASIVFYTGSVNDVLRIIGLIILALGVVAFIVSVLQMKDNWRAGVQREEKTELVTTGIYCVSRNPAFLGFDLMYIGIMIAFFNWYLCVATCLVMVLFHLQIVNVEEDFLIEAFGDEYIKYRKKVCRYFGRKFWI
ncbi:MAG: isoprenylcysteine carboxylmethyltransferase family protein [Lachnospiraceae bacterium]|nr:isoprenylcysteine carboxylmethyltransferase family protein [Lachnospiraceae bacterium]